MQPAGKQRFASSGSDVSRDLSKFKYLSALGYDSQKVQRWMFACVFVFIALSAAVLIDLVNSDIRQKAKHRAEQSHFNSTLTAGRCARWPLTKRTKPWIKASKMSFLYWHAELTLGAKLLLLLLSSPLPWCLFGT